jgi:hypothetical protein
VAGCVADVYLLWQHADGNLKIFLKKILDLLNVLRSVCGAWTARSCIFSAVSHSAQKCLCHSNVYVISLHHCTLAVLLLSVSSRKLSVHSLVIHWLGWTVHRNMSHSIIRSHCSE